MIPASKFLERAAESAAVRLFNQVEAAIEDGQLETTATIEPTWVREAVAMRITRELTEHGYWAFCYELDNNRVKLLWTALPTFWQRLFWHRPVAESSEPEQYIC